MNSTSLSCVGGSAFGVVCFGCVSERRRERQSPMGWNPSCPNLPRPSRFRVNTTTPIADPDERDTVVFQGLKLNTRIPLSLRFATGTRDGLPSAVDLRSLPPILHPAPRRPSTTLALSIVQSQPLSVQAASQNPPSRSPILEVLLVRHLSGLLQCLSAKPSDVDAKHDRPTDKDGVPSDTL